MHKQQPQTAYRKDAVLTGTIFENCDKYKQPKAPIRQIPDGGLWRVRYSKKALPKGEPWQSHKNPSIHKNPPGSGFLCIEGWESI